MEERLLSSAFYNLSMQLHRNAVENRLAGVSGNASAATGPAGQSFLARQRQVTAQATHTRQDMAGRQQQKQASGEFGHY